MAKKTQPDPASLYSGLSDEQVNALFEALSKGVTEEEMRNGGVDMGGYQMDGLSGTMGRVHDAMAFGDVLVNHNHGISPSPTMQGYQAYREHSFNKSQMKRKRAADAAQREAYSDYMKARKLRLQQVQQELAKRKLKARVNGYFSSESMQGLYDTLQDRHLQNSLAQISQQYENQLRNSAFQTASQGLTGSSVDAERRGTVQQGQNAAAIQAQAEAQQFAQSARNNNEQQRQALLGTVQSGSPYEGAAFDQRLQSISHDTAAMGQQYANTAALGQINQSGYNMQSQALGNLMSNYANLYRMQNQGNV